MKWKLDENLDHRLTAMFIKAGHDADTVLAEGLCGHDDSEVYKACLIENRALLTLDRPVLPHIQALLQSFILELARRDPRGATWVVEPGRIRIFEPSDSCM